MQPNFLHFSLLITLLLLLSISTKTTANFKHGLGGNESDQEALLAFKAEISGALHSAALTSWNKSLHFCQWEGVTCGRRHQRVVSLNLESHNLAGKLSPFVGNLSFLSQLDLSGNSFRGEIPSQISFLSRLRVLMLDMNYFEGEIPTNLSSCLHLNLLSLSHNNLVGKIPTRVLSLPSLKALDVLQNDLSGRLQDIGIGNMSVSLQKLRLSANRFRGSIPDDIGRFEGLTGLGLAFNLLNGTIPQSIFNLSNLNALDLGHNKLQGELPQDLGLRLPNLSYLFLPHCSLTGEFPASISNLSKLIVLELSFNSFEGMFRMDGNNMPQLTVIYIQFAFSLRGEARDLNFLDNLTNCTSLKYLMLRGNSFTGNFPRSIFNLSTDLRELELGSNHLFGTIPLGLGRFVNLLALWLDDNHFREAIPLDIGMMGGSIQRLNLSSNQLSGEIPSSMGNLTNLNYLGVSSNKFQGSLPGSFGNLKNLQGLFLTCNNFSGTFPAVLFHASGLLTLSLGQNSFSGSLPEEFDSFKSFDELDVSQNRFSGEIPSSLGNCTGLTGLNLSRNSFAGFIPESFSSLQSIQYLDLSSNKLSGQIPNFLSTWPFLSNLNLSFNNLSGEVPKNGIFANTSAVSVFGNDKLCGGVAQLHLPSCPKPKQKRLSPTMVMIICTTCTLFVVLLVVLSIYFLYCSRKRKDSLVGPKNIKQFVEVSYQMLHMATSGFSLSNFLGSGGFGSVYKGILHQDDGMEVVVAIKVMNLQNEGAGKSFITECKALRNIRHRNLVKVITACSSIDAQRRDFKALVYEFIPRGSLEQWLYSPNLVPVAGSCLSLWQRISIVIDIASALAYLHIECGNPIIHCDLKPSNILLDDEMTARVGDFGLAKFFSKASIPNNDTNSTQVKGTVGYVAPEYGIGSKVSPEGDIYSLGIIILEVMTSKKPTDTMFNNGLNLHDFAKSTLPNRMMEIIDHGMFGDDEVLRSRNAIDIKKKECIKSIIAIGVQCSMELPQDRMKINDVVNQLNSTKKSLHGGTRL